MFKERKTKNSKNHSELIKTLLHSLPKEEVIHEPEELSVYECDGLTAFKVLPLAVVIPQKIAEILVILSACKRFGVPIVVRGGGTGLSGGATPVEGGIVLSLSKFNQILEIDPINRIARVEPGVTNMQVSQAAAPYGLYFAPDPSSQIACTIGGNIAENAGGIHCLKYGLTVNNVLAIKMLTVEGEIVSIGNVGGESPGCDLLSLIVGSEGMLGIVIEATLRLVPKPECAKLVVGCFDDITKASKTVSQIIASGIVPAGLEIMDKLVIEAVQFYIQVGFPISVAAVLLCELDGMFEEVEEECRLVKQMMIQMGATEIILSKNEEERLLLWKARKSAFPAAGRISPDYYCMDGTIPRKSLAFVLNRIAELAAQYNLRVGNVFHAGDGNIHPLILYDNSIAGEKERVESLGEKILELCVEVGGSITGEHGVGLEKLGPMCFQFSLEEIWQFHRLKRALDPHALLNPGKAIPTLHRCAEFGKMHVHQGQIAFRNVERF